MIFIVSVRLGRPRKDRPFYLANSLQTAKSDDAKELSLALNRVGHHIRESIVEQARVSLGDSEFAHFAADHGVPEPIPENQELINKQADAAIKDLFPRIPNADRETIIQHSFKLVSNPYPLRHASMIRTDSRRMARVRI